MPHSWYNLMRGCEVIWHIDTMSWTVTWFSRAHALIAQKIILFVFHGYCVKVCEGISNSFDYRSNERPDLGSSAVHSGRKDRQQAICFSVVPLSAYQDCIYIGRLFQCDWVHGRFQNWTWTNLVAGRYIYIYIWNKFFLMVVFQKQWEISRNYKYFVVLRRHINFFLI